MKKKNLRKKLIKQTVLHLIKRYRLLHCTKQIFFYNTYGQILKILWTKEFLKKKLFTFSFLR